MTNAQMITAILSAIQTDTALINLIRVQFPTFLAGCDTTKLQNLCTVLGINTSGS